MAERVEVQQGEPPFEASYENQPGRGRGNFRGRGRGRGGQQGELLYVKKNASQEEKEKDKQIQLEQIERDRQATEQIQQQEWRGGEQQQHEEGNYGRRFNDKGRFRGRGGRGRGRGEHNNQQEWGQHQEQENQGNQERRDQKNKKEESKFKKPEIKLTKEQIREKELEEEIFKAAQNAKTLEEVKREKAAKIQVKEGRKIDQAQFSNMEIANKDKGKTQAAQSSTNIEYMYRPENQFQKSELVSFKVQQEQAERGFRGGRRRGGRGRGRGRGFGGQGGFGEEHLENPVEIDQNQFPSLQGKS